MATNQNIDLILSGSGVKFPYFVGCLKYLQENNYNIKAVSGTSGGSLIASIIAQNIGYDIISNFLVKNKFLSILDFKYKFWNKWSLFRINEDKFKKYLSILKIDPEMDICESKLPLKIVATNLTKSSSLKDSTYSLNSALAFLLSSLKQDLQICL